MGPHYANFRAITDDLRAHNAIRVAPKEELAKVLIDLLNHPEEAGKMGERARQVFEQQAGATGRSIAALREILDVSSTSPIESRQSVRGQA
jgi:3-deoxy-D-manno-octulosonic-acid transferase